MEMAEPVPSSGFRAPNVPTIHKSLSLKLFQVMEDIDATTENREKMIETSTFSDILGTIAKFPTFTWNTFGSSYEGSTTYDMESDVDNVLVYQDFGVVEDCSSAPSGKCLLIIQDEATPAGYAKTQLVFNGNPLFATDRARVFLADNVFKMNIDNAKRLILTYNLPHILENIASSSERHGPAMSVNPNRGQVAKDMVLALRCNTWPACAANWLTRPRQYNWPPPGVLKACESLGCLLVSIGHPQSEEEQMQWRVSLSYQERLLVTQFNSVQLKCFILLKLIKKDIINKLMGQESLSSYHLKTYMLYMIENSPSYFWKPENLLTCLVICLEKIQDWVNNGICPNYFIPEENMFERRVHGAVQEKLLHVLQRLLTSDCRFLTSLHTSAVGERLLFACSVLPPTTVPTFATDFECNISRIGPLGMLSTISLYIMHCRNAVLQQSLTTNESVVTSLFNKVKQLKEIETVTVHTKEETKRVMSLLMPYLELSLMSSIVALAVEQKKSEDTIWSYLSSAAWAEVGSLSDAFTSKLKQATLMYMCGYYEASVDILKPLENHNGFAVCDCEENQKVMPHLETLLDSTNQGTQLTVEEFVKSYISPCIVFLPTERNLVPLPLQYEMRRSEGMPIGSRHEPIHFWYDWAIVDANVMLYFMLYLNHKELNCKEDVNQYFEQFQSLAGDKSHIVTRFNLLGWVYKDRGLEEEAGEMYKLSLAMKPDHNAVLLHLDDF